MQQNIPTIYALATPPGRAGIAVIRISGANASKTLSSLTTLPAPREASLRTLKDGKNFLDRALCIFFPAPHSFTGEDVVELHLHGGRAVVKSVLDYLGRQGSMRLAEPGEFTRRAFINGKLDLAEAEGLADLINAETESQHIQAIRQYSGENSERFEALRASVIHPLALLEAYIDFPDENIPESVLRDVAIQIDNLRDQIRNLLKDGAIGEQIRSGIEIVLIGAPNSGKSTLINALTKRDIAIVSPEAGTTRDLLEAPLDIGGYKVTLIDTAGIRETTHEVEQQGILRTRSRAREAALKLLLFDTVTETESQSEVLALMDKNCIKIYTKCDLKSPPSPALAISAKTGAGMEDLIAAIKFWLDEKFTAAPSPLITQARHRRSLESALSALENFSIDAPLEIQCEELRHAAAVIAKITGKIAVDDLLDIIFANFCIGK
jgi:tRNA modification GTPase